MAGIVEKEAIDRFAKDIKTRQVDAINLALATLRDFDLIEQVTLKNINNMIKEEMHNYEKDKIRRKALNIGKKEEPVHKSDCAVHNAPAEKPGKCDCGAVEGKKEAPKEPSNSFAGVEGVDKVK